VCLLWRAFQHDQPSSFSKCMLNARHTQSSRAILGAGNRTFGIIKRFSKQAAPLLTATLALLASFFVRPSLVLKLRTPGAILDFMDIQTKRLIRM
jgi:hypothetical protein